MNGPNWPIGLLASAFRMTAERQRCTMAICVGYFEECASFHDRGMITVTGLVAEKPRWVKFDERWPRALRAARLVAFDGQAFATALDITDRATDPSERQQMVQSLSRLVDEHVLCGLSCSVAVDDYESVNERYAFRETLSGPYGLCAGRIIACLQEWMGAHRPADLTLFVFQDGELGHQEVQRVLSALGIHRGEPVQVWPRQWTDQQGRRRFLRPFEACDLLIPDVQSGLADRLRQRSAFEQVRIDRAGLIAMSQAMAVPRRLKADLQQATG